jgi:hypothetical protein
MGNIDQRVVDPIQSQFNLRDRKLVGGRERLGGNPELHARTVLFVQPEVSRVLTVEPDRPLRSDLERVFAGSGILVVQLDG